jgi:23S rRNA (uracil1939-C5)-methyltransferase
MTLENVKLDTHVYGGESLGRLADGRAVFVPYTIPGETVSVKLVEDKPRFARAELIEVLAPSPKRVAPRCPHFTQCGGCHYQHIPYEKQLQIKADILCDQLARIGGLKDPLVHPAQASPEFWNYRNHIQFHITSEGKLGFQAPRRQGIIPIEECHLPENIINATWPLLEIESIPGLDRVGLRVGANDDLLLVLESSDPEPMALNIDLPISVVHLGPGGSLVLAGDDHIVIETNQRLFRVSTASFFQTNIPMSGKMVTHLLDHLPLTPQTTLIEAYCGVGLFSAFLAPHVERLIGIEASPSACEDFVTNLDEFDHVELYEAPVEIVLPGLDATPDIIVVDPPRSGLDRQTLDGILTLGAETLAYISCDPATLARDAKRLTRGGYTLQQITPFDLFPQTYHIESISFWHKA